MSKQSKLDALNDCASEVFDAASPEAWDNAMVKLLAQLEEDCWEGAQTCEGNWPGEKVGGPWRKRARKLQRWQASLVPKRVQHRTRYDMEDAATATGMYDYD